MFNFNDIHPKLNTQNFLSNFRLRKTMSPSGIEFIGAQLLWIRQE